MVTLCRVSPLVGLALHTKFRLVCKGTDGPLPGLDLQHAIISNPVHGFFDILYPKVSHDILLPDPLSAALNWTITFPGHSGCDVRDGCTSNCCPVFKANVSGDGRARAVPEILDDMKKLLQDNGTVVSFTLVAFLISSSPLRKLT